VLTGPYDQELRDELRRQLDELGVELRLSTQLHSLPDAPPATAAGVSVETEGGETLTADIWFRAFGVAPATDYLRGTLAGARDANGYIHVDEYLRVAGHEHVYAIGDISDADRNMAGMAGAQAELLAANLRAQLTGEGERTAYAAWPPVIAVPLGPEGGAGQLPGQDGIAGPELVAELKGREMLVERNAALFDAGAEVA
jgi:NADH dehydrogenase FAD-containing subunit